MRSIRRKVFPVNLRAISVLLLSLTFAFALYAEDGGLFAQRATSIWAALCAATIASPDGKKAILVRPPRDRDSDEIHVVSVRANGKEFPTKIGAWVNAEALWSPDSTAFFVTFSDGGNIGTYHLKVFYVSDSGLRVVEPIPKGRNLVRPRCFDAEYPNVAGVRWAAHDSSRILIAVQVPPHSSCASMGTFTAFEINPRDSKVIRKFDQLAAKKMFAEALGEELRNATDSCVLKPQTCVPPGLTNR
jgi:hypothetical protein